MHTPEELRYWLALLRAPGIGPVHATRLLRSCGDPQDIFGSGSGAWRKAGVPGRLHDGLRNPDWKAVALDEAWLSADPQRGLLTLDHPDYPAQLLQAPQPPVALYFHGDVRLLQRQQLAVIGARTATPQGVENAAAFAGELTRRGLLVTSGLALGVDGAAHRGALAADGATVAVCGTGLDRVYPARHRELAHEIATRGLLLSEFPVGTPPEPGNFPRRNRIISGLSLGVLVVEAALRSGALITARQALEQGREVFAIPGSIHSPMSRGCHALIRQGAKLTESVPDILEELGAMRDNGLDSTRSAATGDNSVTDLEPMHQRVLQALGFEATPLDSLVERLALPVETLSTVLLALELKGLVSAMPGGQYQRVGLEE